MPSWSCQRGSTLTMVPPLGILITVSVLLAAGLAAYENEHVRAWIDQQRQKIAIALHSLGDDVDPRVRSVTRDDPSTREDASEVAEMRRQQARAEILERGRIMEERRRRKLARNSTATSSNSFDSLVDKDGNLKGGDMKKAISTAVESYSAKGLTSRHVDSAVALQDSVDSPIVLRQLDQRSADVEAEEDPFTSRYEEEMRNAWNLPLPTHDRRALSSHASESLIDLTPTSEEAPDPEMSIPDIRTVAPQPTLYFSAAASNSSHTMSNTEPEYYYAHPSNPQQPVLSPLAVSQTQQPISVSSVPSIAGSMDHVHASEVAESDDGVMSEFGDGMHTPTSAWSEVGSQISSDAGQ